MTKSVIKNEAMMWTLDDQGHLTVRWDVAMKAAAPAHGVVLRTMTQAVAAPVRLSRTVALAAYSRFQAAHVHRAA